MTDSVAGRLQMVGSRLKRRRSSGLIAADFTHGSNRVDWNQLTELHSSRLGFFTLKMDKEGQFFLSC